MFKDTALAMELSPMKARNSTTPSKSYGLGGVSPVKSPARDSVISRTS